MRKGLIKKKWSSFLIVLLWGLALSLHGQNIRVFYFAPNDSITAHFTGASAPYINPRMCNGNATGYSNVLLDGVTAPAFRRVAPPNIRQVYDSLTAINSVLRRTILKISGLSNGLVGDVNFYLFDDRTGFGGNERCLCRKDYGTGGSSLIGTWACASNFLRNPGGYLGYVYLGERASGSIKARPGGYWALYQTLVHEFSHTQFAKEYTSTGDSVQNKWGRRGISISYGGDQGHWGSEIQADQQSALDEGLATFWGYDRNPAARTTLVDWLNNKNERMYLGSHSFLTGTPEMWDSPHNVVHSTTVPADRRVTPPGWNTFTLVAPHIQTGARYELREYKWLDVPGKYEFYNERMFSAFALMFHENALSRRDTTFNIMLRAAKKMTPANNRLRYPAVFANALCNELEAYARTPAGQAEQTSGTLASSMFVYALYDIVTHFGMTREDMERELRVGFYSHTGVTQPLAFASYWGHRDAVKQLVCPHLGGNSCQSGSGNINFVTAATTARDYFRDPSRILR